jgi:uncharacterized protein involved in exopolysaccharide biosynthesis
LRLPVIQKRTLMSEDVYINPSEPASDSAKPQAPPIFRHSPDGAEIDLMVVAILLFGRWRKILTCSVAAALLTVGIVFFVIRPTYTAKAVFLPPETSPGSGMAELASQLGSMSPLGLLSGGLKGSGGVYTGILGSRTIADDLIKQFNLQKVYGTKLLSDTEKKLKKNSSFTVGKDTLVTIAVKDHDRERAAALANAYLSQLTAANGRLALTGASQRRLFFQQQLEREKDALEDAEVALQKTQEKTGIISPTDQSRVMITAIEQTRAQIAADEVELSALQQSTTNQNPDVIRLRAEMAGLQEQLEKQENGRQSHRPGSIQPPTAKVPALELEYVRKAREVKYHEALFNILARQYEAARLAEARQSPVLQVVDQAVVPDKKSGPPRLLLTIAGFFVGGMVGCFWVLWSEFSREWKLARQLS